MNIQSSEISIAVRQQKPSLIALLNASFTLIDATDGLLELFGLEADMVKGKNWFAIFPGLSKDWRIRLEHTLYGVKNVRIVDKVLLPDGTTQQFIWHFNPWKDSSEKQFGVFITVASE